MGESLILENNDTKTINLTITKEDALFLSSCLDDLQTIFFNGTSEVEGVQEQARANGIKLNKIQSEILSLI